jgi:putative ATP-dependent endonuclease of the OLD family
VTNPTEIAVITKAVLKNFRRFRDSTIEFTPGLNILVGDNESGKTTVLEAINLALTSRWQGRYLNAELSPHFLNADATYEYLDGLKKGTNPAPPELVVELFLADVPDTAALKGTNNSLGEDAPGLRLSASLDPDFADEYKAFISDPSKVRSVPTEYYRVDWYDFARQIVNSRSVKVTASVIDASRIRLQSGADFYLQQIITGSLDPKERAQLARAYRSFQEAFADDPAIGTINTALDASQDSITDKKLTMEINTSQSNQWDSALAPHLDRLPLHVSGSGEQNKLKILLALARKVEDAHLILIEEPENHLSFSSLNQLIEKISSKCAERQVIVSTHSSYVINKLGLERLMLLSGNAVTRTSSLSNSTQEYFRKLSGYDTLRLVLAKAVILVEGPSDELIVQRAYFNKYEKRPIEDGIDVINVRGLSAKRFLDLAVPLGRRTAVVADNDGDYTQKVDAKYIDYSGYDFITIHRSDNNALKTLEPQLIAANDLDVINRALNASFASKPDAEDWMKSNKTDAALALHDTTETLTMPAYIQEAINGIGQ